MGKSFNPAERELWTQKGNSYRRAPTQEQRSIRLERRHTGEEKGWALCAAAALPLGTVLGQLHGKVQMAGTAKQCGTDMKGAKAVVMLKTRHFFAGRSEEMVVVDVADTVFYYMNHASEHDEANNVQVDPKTAEVKLTREVAKGEELCWDYGEHRHPPLPSEERNCLLCYQPITTGHPFSRLNCRVQCPTRARGGALHAKCIRRQLCHSNTARKDECPYCLGAPEGVWRSASAPGRRSGA